MRVIACLTSALICIINLSYGQVDSSAYKIAQFPNTFFAKINRKTASLDDALTRQTERYLNRLAARERKIQTAVIQAGL